MNVHEWLIEVAEGQTAITDLAETLGVQRSKLYRWLADGRVTKTADVAALVAVWERHSPEPSPGSHVGALAMWQMRRDALVAGLCGL